MGYLDAMRIATWNINGVRARLEFVQRWLDERRPDLLGVQELKSDEEQFPFDAFAECGYHVTAQFQKAWNGVAILSRTPAQTAHVGLPGRDADGARLVAAEVAGLHFVTVYCPNGKSIDHPDFWEKLKWYDALFDFLDARYTPADPVVLCGDFNVVPAAVDSWSEDLLAGGIFHTVAERERIARLQAWGLCDLWRAQHPVEPGFTWWDYRGNSFKKKRGLRIDFILATDPVRARLQFITPDTDWRDSVAGLTPSDHAPVYADLA